MNPLKALEELGQSVWLDYLSRGFVARGELARLVARDGVKGVTSNPSIFEKAIAHSDEYDAELSRLLAEGDMDVGGLFQRLAVRDIRKAADVLRPVYRASGGADGFISLEVSPYLAAETAATLAEARALWRAVGRRNLMIKVPGTEAGLGAIRTLIGEGINVNVTLLFSLAAYEAVAEAYLAGLETLAAKGEVSQVASVASFFLSRIDTKVDALVEERLKGASAAERRELEGVRGKAAIASAKLAYQSYKRIFAGPRWQALVARGAKPQRLLWASTGTKNKAYSDVLYVEELIGRDTVNTMPPATLEAFRDHGKPQLKLETDLAGARATVESLERLGISLDRVTDELLAEGVKLFADAADQLYAAVAGKRAKLLGAKLAETSYALGEAAADVDTELKRWTDSGGARRLWRKDCSLWTGADEDKWLGWLDIVAREHRDLGALERFARAVKKARWSDVVLLGMGGSSLGPEALAETLEPRRGWPRFRMLDSTDPDQVRATAAAIRLRKTLFIVSSKSGSTLEPNILKDEFWARLVADGVARPGRQFVAVTDPGSALETAARRAGFARIFHGDPAIGGRYSVLSKFGLVPAAAMGIDVRALLEAARHMVLSCGALVPPAANPGVRLGVALGVLALRHHRDKITILAPPKLAGVGAWLEQLIAESTGKQGKGLIPVDREPLAPAGKYGSDRVFVYLQGAGTDRFARAAADLERAGHPVIRMRIRDPRLVGQLFFAWETAIAVAGSLLGINPFDQPDVEASKIKTRELTAAYERKGSLPEETLILAENGIALYADPRNAKALGHSNSVARCLKLHLARLRPGDYLALLAYVARNPRHEAALQAIRRRIRDATGVATCLGFGPRFLHSTGQVYKGGPNSGVFLQITCDHARDLPVPGKKLGFGIVEAAQARGDFSVLAARKRRALHIHLKNAGAGLRSLGRAVEEALT